MLRRVVSTEAVCSQDRIKDAMRRLKRFKRADLEVAGRIGKGAYGGVWQATVLENKTEVVVKVVFPDPDLDPEESAKAHPSEEKLSSFRREIEIMSVLGKHPNITTILGITSDSRVLVLEEAISDLHQMIKNQKRSLSLAIARRWSRELLDGVAYLHGISIVHRDLKPSNMLIFKDMTLKLGDFGLAREAAPSETLPVRREICTLWYRAPELIMGDANYNSRIDVWSAGCILLEMLVGRCATAGRVEEVCKCPKPTHFNYNSDQLMKIFRLVGTPTDTNLLNRMQCLHHFQGWPAYPRALEDIVEGACTAERLHDTADAARQLAQQWSECLSGMLEINPAKRVTANEVINSPFWKTNAADAVPMLSGVGSAGSAGSSGSRNSHGSNSDRSQYQAPAEKPKLAMNNKRHSAPLPSKTPLQPLQGTNQRRLSHMIPLEKIGADRAGDKDFTTGRRVASIDSGDLLLSGSSVGGVGLQGKGLMSRARSSHSTGKAVVRVSSGGSGYAKGKSSFTGAGRTDKLLNGIFLDSIG